MATLKRIGSTAHRIAVRDDFGFGCCPRLECGEPVSLAKLIANPDAYHGKAL